MRLSLPVMQCDKGCSDCCGPVICKPHEYQAVVAYAASRSITPVQQGLTCPWFHDGQCQVYPVRPWICQMFGHSPTLVCSKGYNRNVSKMTEARMARQYGLDKASAMFLHEVLLPKGYTADDVRRIMA